MDAQGISIKIFNAKIITPFHLIENGTVMIRDGFIESVEAGYSEISAMNEIDAKGNYLSPGLIDIQINGFMGVDFADPYLSIEGIRQATKALWKVGVTSFLPTVITNSQESLKNSFTILATALDDEESGDSIPGFHLEGPYISPAQGYRGAHLEKYIRVPDWDEFAELQMAANQRIKLITLAPESDGAIPFIRKCVDSGVAVALGHHNGSSKVIKESVEAGASLATHLGNGCANTIDRHNNPFWPQLANDGMTATIIADGAHLNQDELQCFYKMKGVDRTILVSDALDLAGLPPGEYFRGERTVLLTPEVVKFPEENCLAGAATPISSCVTKMMKFTGCSLENALQMASSNPAKMLGLTNIGEIAQGKRADLILFTIEDGKMIFQKTIVAGKIVLC
jgi:N-acetylglucosamine-6-phosphate deacetylase